MRKLCAWQPATNTFEEGIDTTLFDTFTSGTFTPITFVPTSPQPLRLVLQAVIMTKLIPQPYTQTLSHKFGLPNASTFTFDNIWDPSDTGLTALKTASDSQSKRAFRFTFGLGGKVMLFYGYVGASLLPTGSAQQLVTTQAVITMNGTPTYYAS